MLGATWDPHWLGARGSCPPYDIMMGLMVTITHVFANNAVWKSVFGQFAPEVVGKHVPGTVMVRGTAIANNRGATVEDLKQFMREALNNAHRMRSPFLVFLGVAPMVWVPVGSRNMGTFTKFS